MARKFLDVDGFVFDCQYDEYDEKSDITYVYQIIDTDDYARPRYNEVYEIKRDKSIDFETNCRTQINKNIIPLLLTEEYKENLLNRLSEVISAAKVNIRSLSKKVVKEIFETVLKDRCCIALWSPMMPHEIHKVLRKDRDIYFEFNEYGDDEYIQLNEVRKKDILIILEELLRMFTRSFGNNSRSKIKTTII